MQTRGGAERVLLELVRHLDASACVGFVDRTLFPDAFEDGRLFDLNAHQRFDALRIAHMLYAFSTRGADIASRFGERIYSGAYSVLAERAGHEGRSIYYCHTPPRFLYDLRRHYESATPMVLRPALASLRNWLQPRFEAAVRRMDIVLANSENVRSRLRQHLGVEARVVYPPVDTHAFRWLSDDGYFLSTARLEPLKRVDVLIRAFLRMPSQRLVVTSGGSELARLRELARGASNIHFTGWIDDVTLSDCMGRARATVYVPVDEDFGMSPVESMAAGKPVIGVAQGGLLETVRPGETGVLLAPDFDTEEVCRAVLDMSQRNANEMRSACEERAAMFSRARFLERMDSILQHPDRQPH
ncbi:glycosyl transferase [Pseudazoarcus pumilus]|uniref:Glycosyl transferase n=2 Tax=Pseudazoarcus pumilus TaxID=2067960 RepID=A0A2I6S8Y4_9RHOO|nr:glycosyl transferase [Pseudazoarcus pumilus]